MFRDLQSLESILKIHYTKTTNWCSGPEFYWSVENSLRPGTVNLSPAWFAQEHEAKHHLLKVSLDLQNGVVLKWLCKCCCHLHLSVVCWVLCNWSCSNKLGQEAFRWLAANPKASDNPNHLMEVLEIWYALFLALAVISNQSTPLHCDVEGRPEWLDFILALGNYNHGQFAVPAFEYTFKYNTGTFIAFSRSLHSPTLSGWTPLDCHWTLVWKISIFMSKNWCNFPVTVWWLSSDQSGQTMNPMNSTNELSIGQTPEMAGSPEWTFQQKNTRK